MARMNLMELVISATVENQQVLTGLKQIEEARKRALEIGDKSGLQGDLDSLAKAAANANKGLAPLSKTSATIAQDMRELGIQVKSGIVGITDGAKRYRELEQALNAQLGTLKKGSSEYKTITISMREAGQEAARLESLVRRTDSAFSGTEMTRYSATLEKISNAEKAGFATREQTIGQLRQLQGEVREYANGLEQSGQSSREAERMMAQIGTEMRKLEAEVQKLDASFRTDYMKLYSAELRNIDAQVKDLGFDKASAEVERLTNELKVQQNVLATDGREMEQLSRILQQAAQQQERYQKAAQDAARATNASEIQSYKRELEQLTGSIKDAVTDLGKLDAQQRAIRWDTGDVAAYRSQQEALARSSLEISQSLEKTGASLNELQGRMRDYASSTELGVRESSDLSRALKETDSAMTRLAAAQDKVSASFRDANLSRFTSELQRIEQAQRSGLMTYEQAARSIQDLKVEFQQYAQALTGSASQVTRFSAEMRQFDASASNAAQGVERTTKSVQELGSRVSASAGDLRALEAVERQLDAAATSLAASQERVSAAFRASNIQGFKNDLSSIVTANKEGVASFEQSRAAIEQLQGKMRDFAQSTQLTARETEQLQRVMLQTTGAAERMDKAFHAEQLRTFNSTLLDLKRSVENSGMSVEQFGNRARELANDIEAARTGVERSTQSYVNYTHALTRVDSSLAQAEGRIRKFGVSSAVTVGITDQLQNVMYMLGPAGEAMAVSMGAASTGMAGAATSAKLLNVALAAGLVGAIIAAALAIGKMATLGVALEATQTRVAKTTGLTAQQMGVLTNELQKVSIASGTPTKNLLELAEVAGSLGVTGVKNIASFTRTMDALTKATNIVGQEGAEQMAKFINLTLQAGQTMGSAAELVGNVINALGSSLAATEADILHMASQLGRLSTSAGLSQTDILALAGTFSSLGLSAELAGTNVTKIFTDMQKAAANGGKELTAFANAAGMTEQAFAALVKQNPMEAFMALVKGMKATKDAGGDLIPVVDSIAGKNSEMARVLLTSVGGYNTLVTAMKTANTEAKTQTSLWIELAKTTDTTRGQFQIMGSLIRTVAEDIGLRLNEGVKEAVKGTNLFLLSIGDLITYLRNGDGAIAQFAQTVTRGMGDAFRVVGESAKIVGTALSQTFGIALSAATTFVRGLIQGNQGVSSAIAWIGQAFGNMGQAIADVFGNISKTYYILTNASSDLSNSLTRIFLGIGDVLQGFGYMVYGYVVEPFVNMVAPIQQAAVSVLQTVQNWVGQVGKFFQPIIDLARSVGKSIGDFFGAGAEMGRDALNSLVTEGIEPVVKSADDYVQGSRAIDQANTLIARGTSGITNAVGDMQNAVTRAGQEFDTIGSASQKAGQNVSQSAQQMAGAMGDVTNAQDALATAVSKFASLQQMNRNEAQQYLASLQQLKEAYPKLASNLNPLITQTQAYLQGLKDTGPAAQGAATSTQQMSKAQAEATRSAESYHEKLGALRDAQAALAEGTVRSSESAFEMARGLLEATEGAKSLSGGAERAATSLIKLGTSLSFKEANAEMKQLEANARLTGDSSTLAADKAEIWKQVMLQLSAELGANAEATKRAAAEYQKYSSEAERQAAETERLSEITKQNAEAQTILAEQSSKSADELRNMAAGLLAIASGSTNADAEARALAASLEQVAAQKDFVTGMTESVTRFGESLKTSVMPMGELSARLQEIERNARLTGDSTTVAADKAEAYKTAMTSLAGILGENNIIVKQLQTQYQSWASEAERAAAASELITKAQEALNGSSEMSAQGMRQLAIEMATLASQGGEGAAQLQQLATSLSLQAAQMDASARAAQNYQANLETVRSAQEALGDASGIATEDIRGMIAGLDAAAQGAGKLGAEARQAQADLEALLVAREIASGLQQLGEMARYALENIPGLSAAAQAALAGLEGSASAAYKALQDGAFSAEDAIGVVGSALSSIGDALQEEIGATGAAAFSALGDAASAAAAGFSVGGPIGAAIGGLVGLVSGLVSSWGEAAQAAEEAAERAEAAWRKTMDIFEDSTQNVIEKNLDTLKTINDMQLEQGKISEYQHLVTQTQIQLAEAQIQLEQDLIDLEKRRQEALDAARESGASQEQIDAINQQFDAEQEAIYNGYSATTDAIITGAEQQAAALDVGHDKFLADLAQIPADIAQYFANGEFTVTQAIDHFTTGIVNHTTAAVDAVGNTIASIAAEQQAGLAKLSATTSQWGTLANSWGGVFNQLAASINAGGNVTNSALQNTFTQLQGGIRTLGSLDASILGNLGSVLLSGFTQLGRNAQQGGQHASSSLAGARSQIQAALAQLGGLTTNTLTPLANLLNAGFQSVTLSAQQGGERAAGALTTSGNLIKNAFNVFNTINVTASLSAISNQLGSSFGNLISTTSQLGGRSAAAITQAGQVNKSAALSSFSGVAQAFASSGTQTSGASRGAFTAILSAVNAGSNQMMGGIRNSGSQAQGAVRQNATLLQGAFNALSGTVGGAANKAFAAIMNQVLSGAGKLEAGLRSSGSKAQSAAQMIGQLTASGFNSAENAASSAINSFFSRTRSSVDSGAGALANAILSRSATIKNALSGMSSVVSNFKWPSLPPPPKIPSVSGFTARAQQHMPGVTNISVPDPKARAYAASVLPGYTSATIARAYAAGEAFTAPLDAFASTLGASMRASNVQLTISGDLLSVLAGPSAVLERAANLSWEAAQLQAKAAQLFYDTVERLGEKAGVDTFDAARSPSRGLRRR